MIPMTLPSYQSLCFKMVILIRFPSLLPNIRCKTSVLLTVFSGYQQSFETVIVKHNLSPPRASVDIDSCRRLKVLCI